MKAAVIGLGPHGQRIVSVLRDLPHIELAAVVDRSESALAEVDVPPSTARYTSADLVWSHSDVPLVCIATNADSHEALAVAAMERGSRYLLVEKPMA
jgi:predicted dehydrogenase